LGERIATAEQIRGGRTTVEEAAGRFGVPPDEIRAWLTAHADDHTLHLTDLRGEIAGEPGRLERQALRLRHLIARTDRTLQFLHAQLLSRKLA